MLEGLRAASQNWIGRGIMALVLGFTLVAFAFWGVGDIFRGMTSRRLVRIGGAEISAEAYRSAYDTQLRNLQQRLRRAITNEEARRIGLDQQVLDRLVTDAVLDERSRLLGLAMSEEEVQRQLKSEKVFQGPSGEFDPERFRQIIQNAGFNERSFLADQRKAYLHKEIIDSVTAGVEPPSGMLEALHKFRAETRQIDAFLLPAAAVGAIAAPSDDEVKKYYTEREPAFRSREFRKLTVLSATPSGLAKPSDVSDADVRKLYDEVKGQRYGTPEKREVGQITFKTEAEAKDALAQLKGGLAFDALVAERKIAPKDADLGLVTQSDFGVAKVAAAVFALPAPGFADIVETPFGFVVSQVRRIQPGVYTKSFEQAAPELRLELASKKIPADEIRRLHDVIEDQRAAGKPLAEAAKAAGLESRDIDGLDDLGRDRAGKPVVDLPGGADLVKAAFASDKGVDNEAVATRDGGYVWFEVSQVEPARQRSFEETRGEVEAAMRKEAEQKALAAKATELVEKLRKGKPIDNLAGELGLPMRRITDVKRANRPDYPNSAIVQFFEVPVRGAGSTPIEGGELIFFVASDATPPFDPKSPEGQALIEQVKPSLINDLVEEYVGALEKAYNVNINQKVLESVLGGEAEK